MTAATVDLAENAADQLVMEATVLLMGQVGVHLVAVAVAAKGKQGLAEQKEAKVVAVQ